MNFKLKPISQQTLIDELMKGYKAYIAMKIGAGEVPDKSGLTAVSCGFCLALVIMGISEADSLEIIQKASQGMVDESTEKRNGGKVRSRSKKVKSGSNVHSVQKGARRKS